MEENTVGVPSTPRGTWVQVTEGRVFYPTDPQPREVYLKDIAQALSRQVRYNGLSDYFISVGQHSCQAAWMAEMEGYNAKVQLAMLMHDAPETIIGDLIRPVKIQVPIFSVIEGKIMYAMNLGLDLPIIDHKLMKYFDNLCLAWEKRDMYPSALEWPMVPDVPFYCPKMTTWPMEYTERRFTKLFEYLRLEILHG